MRLWKVAFFLGMIEMTHAVTLDPTYWAARSPRGDALAAIDGEEWTVYTTTWPANSNDHIWVDMLAVQTFDNLKMLVGQCDGENINFAASYSDDNVTWVPFWTEDTQGLSVLTYTAPQKLQARYLLFKLTNGVAWCAWEVRDIIVNFGPADVISSCIAPRIKSKKQAIRHTMQLYSASLSHIAIHSNATYSWPAGVNNSLVIDWPVVNVVTALQAMYRNDLWMYKYGLGQDWILNGASVLKNFLVALTNVIVDRLGHDGWTKSARGMSSNYAVGMAFEFLEKHFELGFQLQGKDRARFFQALKMTLHNPSDWMWWVSENSFVDQEAFAVAYLIATTLQYEIKKNPINNYLTLTEVNQWLNASAQFGIQVTQGPVPGTHSFVDCCGFTNFTLDNSESPTRYWINNAMRNKGGKGPRIQSDSATYGGGSLSEGVGPYLFVHHKYPNPFSPEYNNDILWKLIGDWVEGYANLHMPYYDQRAVIVNYGDASFFQATSYFGEFFEVMATVMKNYNLPQAMRLKKVANMIWMFANGGTSTDYKFLIFGDETIPLEETWVPSSYALQYWTQLGVYAQDKLILRTKTTACNRGTQTSVVVQVREDGEHGHGGVGNLAGYFYKGQQIIHNYGYDAAPNVLNHMFLIRPSQFDFLYYSNYKLRLGPRYSRIEAWGWSNSDVPSDWHADPRGFMAEFDKVAYARVDEQYYTTLTGENRFPPGEYYSRQVFKHSREFALDRETGALFIFDTCVPLSTLNKTSWWAYGPVWHISEVLHNLTNGVIGQDGGYWTYGSRNKSAPFSLTMAGPAGTTYNNIYWKFHGAMSGDWGQVYHPHARYEGPVYAGKPISFMTAIVPIDSDIHNDDITAQNVPSPPHYSIEANGGTGTVLIGNRVIRFGTNSLLLPTGQGQSANYAVKFSMEVQEQSAKYIAALLDDGSNTKFETI